MINLETGRKKIGVVDTGSSNLNAVMRSIKKAGFSPEAATPESRVLTHYDCVVLPGVGNFGYVMNQLNVSATSEWLRKIHAAEIPILGICLGAQLLFDSSEESPSEKGFGFIKGDVKKLAPNQYARIPHMGWNEIDVKNAALLFLGSKKSFYFAHSFYFTPDNPSEILAVAQHGAEFCAIAGNQKCLAIQFHPEKSGRSGQELLKRSLEWLCKVGSQNA